MSPLRFKYAKKIKLISYGCGKPVISILATSYDHSEIIGAYLFGNPSNFNLLCHEIHWQNFCYDSF